MKRYWAEFPMPKVVRRTDRTVTEVWDKRNTPQIASSSKGAGPAYSHALIPALRPQFAQATRPVTRRAQVQPFRDPL